MATKKIDVMFLQVGQGMGTLIKVYDNSDALVGLALIDFGSEMRTKQYAGRGLINVTEALSKMASPRIDLLVVSHQDFDHWSLLPDLLAEIDEKYSSCTVGAIYYGGINWSSVADAAIEDWEKRFGVTAVSFTTEESNYDADDDFSIGSFHSIGDVDFHLLVSNVQIPRSEGDLKRNGSSAVIAVEFGGVYVVLPGDAIADTIGWINDNIFEPWGDEDIPVRPCRALSAPHHGALRTIADNYKAPKGTVAQLTKGAAFAAYVEADNVVASAGLNQRFKHPYQSVMELLGAYTVRANHVAHDWVWWSGTRGEWAQVTGDTDGIWTSVTSTTDPSIGRSWYFEISSTGEIEFKLQEEQGQAIPRGRRRERYAAVRHKR